MAIHHLWDIREIYSNEDGSIQFIELFSASANQEFLSGVTLVSTNTDTTIIHTYRFPSNSGTPTDGHSLLLATPGFAALPGGITPDYEIPFDFLFTAGGNLNFNSVTDLDYGPPPLIALPTDGVNSLNINATWYYHC